jgi:hypothetical protein
LFVSQNVRPGAQPHMPELQACPPAQTVVQLPQWASSLLVSTHESPQAVRPLAHIATQVPLLQSGVAPLQTTLQPPQLLGSVPKTAQSPAPQSIVLGGH